MFCLHFLRLDFTENLNNFAVWIDFDNKESQYYLGLHFVCVCLDCQQFKFVTNVLLRSFIGHCNRIYFVYYKTCARKVIFYCVQ